MREGNGEGVMTRAFRLLDAFAEGAPELTLEELAARSGLPRSTTHRLAVQLAAEGALERSRRGWRLGTRMFELGQLVAREQRLRERALAHMQDLYAATGETVQLAVADGDEVLYVEIIGGHRRVKSPSRRGGRMPLHCTALGKALLAFSSDGGRRYLDSRPALPARTPHTITDLAALRAELHSVRARQLAFDREEAALGLRCVAAPVLDSRTRVATAALSVSMATDSPLTPAEAAPAVGTVARALGRAA
ncbi:MAG TPA: IclR family transcriptional regulator [Solirubrobacteraceae bacterium]|nr:IclR family transcriptional regulator [Solirubrobacteraceae bacterium]